MTLQSLGPAGFAPDQSDQSDQRRFGLCYQLLTLSPSLTRRLFPDTLALTNVFHSRPPPRTIDINAQSTSDVHGFQQAAGLDIKKVNLRDRRDQHCRPSFNSAPCIRLNALPQLLATSSLPVYVELLLDPHHIYARIETLRQAPATRTLQDAFEGRS